MKKIKSGFSMVELLFVMAVMAALAAIAIPSMSASQDASTLTSMKSDIRNAINTVQGGAVDSAGDFTQVFTAGDFTEVGETGLTAALDSGDKLVISAGNKITLADGTDSSCFSVKVTHAGLTLADGTTAKEVSFNSCNGGKITAN